MGVGEIKFTLQLHNLLVELGDFGLELLLLSILGGTGSRRWAGLQSADALLGVA